MKNTIIISLLLICGVCTAQDDKKKPEAKLSSANAVAPDNTNSDPKPELKLVDRSTVNKEKAIKKDSGQPELKLISE